MSQIRYLDSAWYTLQERQIYRESSGSSGFTNPAVGTILFDRRWTYEPIDVDGVSLEAITGSTGKYLVGLYASDPSTGLPTGVPVWQAPSIATAIAANFMLRSTTRASIPGQSSLWAAYTQNDGSQLAGPANGFSPEDLGVDPTTGNLFWSYTAPWVFNPAGLPDVSAMTFTPRTSLTFPTGTKMPQIRWRTRR